MSSLLEAVSSSLGITALMAAIFGLISTLYGARRRRSAEQRLSRLRDDSVEVTPLEQKMAMLDSFSKSAAQLSQEIAIEVQAQVEQAAAAKADADKAVAIARLSDEQQIAVANLVRDQIASEFSASDKSQRRNALLWNAGFFLAGVGSSILVTLFVRPF